jgi:pyruvate formate lyase activating enzyme
MYLSPEVMVELARDTDCQGVAWTYNEPTIWLEFTLRGAELCKEKGLYTCYVTNGYITSRALDVIGPYLDIYRVDIKGFSDRFYRELARAKDWQAILQAAERAKNRWKMHLEVVTNVIPTWNDDTGTLRSIARWIVSHLGEDTPWHVTRFAPHLRLSHLPPTPVKTLEIAREIGKEEGLSYVYTGNVPGHPGEHTYCPHCGHKLITRFGFGVREVFLEGGRCPQCGYQPPIIGEVKVTHHGIQPLL